MYFTLVVGAPSGRSSSVAVSVLLFSPVTMSGIVIFVNVVTFVFVPIPNSPFVFCPVPYMFPSISFTIVWFPPAEMSVIPSAIFPIIVLFVVFPIPSCPALFLPHVYSFPFCPRETTCPSPIDADIPWFTTVFTGVLLEVVPPFPNSPWVPFPHTKTHPNSFIAVLPVSPAVMSTIRFNVDAPPSPVTFVAYVVFSLFPIPSCPASFLPHAYTSPSFVNANTWFAPAEILITFSRYVFSFIFIWAGSPIISSFPVIHTVPSAFNIAVNPFPVSICGVAMFSFPDTFTIHIAFTFSYSLCFP